MRDSGHQHHHGVKKNIVEGIGGLIIGAAAVLLAVRFLGGRKKPAPASASALPAPAPTDEVAQAAKRVPARRSAAAVKTAPAAKRSSRTRAKPGEKAATSSATPESPES